MRALNLNKVPKNTRILFGVTEILAAALHLGSAIVFFIYLGDNNVKPMLKTRYQMVDDGVFETKFRNVGRFDVILALAIMSLITASSHIGSVLSMNWWYPLAKKGLNFVWIEYCITSAIMTMVIAVLLGYDDLFTVLAFGMCLTITNLVGLGIEWREYRLNKEERERLVMSSVSLPFMYSSVLTLIPWIAFFTSFIDSVTRGRAPSFVQGIFYSQFLGYCGFAVTFALQRFTVNRERFKKIQIPIRYLYVVQSFTTKMFITWFLASGTIFREN